METVSQEASRRKGEFPNLTWQQVLKIVSSERSNHKEAVILLTCPACGFTNPADIEINEELNSYACVCCGHTNVLTNEND